MTRAVRTWLMRAAALVPLAVGVAALLSCSERPTAPPSAPPSRPAPALSSAKLVFRVQPTNTTAGVAITPAVAVAIQDASGNIITSATGVVTIGWGKGSGVLSGTTSLNAVNGVASFQDLSIERADADYSLVAVAMVSPTLTSAPSASFAVVPAAPSKLAVGGPSPVDATRQFAVGVRISDAFGNSVSSAATNAVTLSLSSNPGGATLAGTLTVPMLGRCSPNRWLFRQ